MSKKAILYDKLPNEKVICTACARYCELRKDQIGLCGIRGNINGDLELFVYGKVIAGHVDPIEKKPVTHYYPGTKIFFRLLLLVVTGCVSIVKIQTSVREEKWKELT